MRHHALAASIVFALITAFHSPVMAFDAKDDAIKAEMQALKGVWKVVGRETDGQKSTDEELKDIVSVRDEAGKVQVRRGEQVILEGTVKIDPTKKPKTMDLTYTAGANQGKTVLAIYDLEGDVQRLCLGRPGGERPTELSAKAGSGQSLITYKRER